MAASSELYGYANDVTTCPICQNYFRDPRSLPCLHTFCLMCLERYWAGKRPARKNAVCPLCMQEFTVHADGMRGLPRNFMIDGMAQSLKYLSLEAGSCDVELSEEFKSKLEQDCKQHGRKLFEMYCEDCSQNLCSSCMTERHRNHRFMKIEEAAKMCKMQMQNDMRELAMLKAKLESKRTVSEMTEKQFMDELETIKSSIKRKGEELKKLIDDTVTELIRDVERVKYNTQTLTSTMPRSHMSLDECLKATQSFIKYCQVVCDRGRSVDITEAAKELQTRVTDLKRNADRINYFSIPCIKFIPADIKTVLDKLGDMRDLIGKLRIPQHLLKPDSKPTETKVEAQKASDLRDLRRENAAIKNDVGEFKRIYKKQGVAGCIAFVIKQQVEWKKLHLNIAIIGNSGVGKSSFINAIRYLTAGDEGAAEIDVVERTRSIDCYSHPDYPNVRFWDLPGVGTPNFPRRTYLQNIFFDQYDFFLLVSCTTFSENDLWLAKEIKRRQRKFYLVRTKIGLDVANDRTCKGREKSELQVLDKIGEEIRRNLRENSLGDVKVFLIDNHLPRDFDFEKLQHCLTEDIPELKELALMMSISESAAKKEGCTIL